MKLLKIILPALLMIFAGCQTSKQLNKSSAVTTEKQQTVEKDTDNSLTKTVTVGTVATSYGDTLSGSLAFTEEQITQMEGYASDSIESNGVKVKVNIVPFKGGFKTNIQAIAKPKTTVNDYIQTKTEQKALTSNKAVATEKKSEIKTKDLKKKSFSAVGLIIGIVFLLLLALLIYYLLKKYKIL